MAGLVLVPKTPLPSLSLVRLWLPPPTDPRAYSAASTLVTKLMALLDERAKLPVPPVASPVIAPNAEATREGEVVVEQSAMVVVERSALAALAVQCRRVLTLMRSLSSDDTATPPLPVSPTSLTSLSITLSLDRLLANVQRLNASAAPSVPPVVSGAASMAAVASVAADGREVIEALRVAVMAEGSKQIRSHVVPLLKWYMALEALIPEEITVPSPAPPSSGDS